MTRLDDLGYKPMKLIYLASPFSSPSKALQHRRYKAVTKAGAYLTKHTGAAFILPITQSYALVKAMPSLGGSFISWAEIDFTLLSKCDELWVLTIPGWRESLGVMSEIKFAMNNNIPMWYVNPKTHAISRNTK